MKNIYKTSLIKALESLKFPIVEFSLQVPKNKNHGDLATNVAFLLSKKINKNPIEIAENIKSELDKTDNFCEDNVFDMDYESNIIVKVD